MFDKIRPLADRVLVKRLENQDRTESGLFIPDVAKEKAQTGEVVAVGNGRVDNSGKTVAMQVKVGDVVYFGKYTGTEAGKDYLIIREEELLGVVEK
jgi:chaperonin GroES